MFTFASVKIFICISLQAGWTSIQPVISDITRCGRGNFADDEVAELNRIVSVLKRKGVVDKKVQKTAV